jgi:hypothetical protein
MLGDRKRKRSRGSHITNRKSGDGGGNKRQADYARGPLRQDREVAAVFASTGVHEVT